MKTLVNKFLVIPLSDIVLESSTRDFMTFVEKPFSFEAHFSAFKMPRADVGDSILIGKKEWGVSQGRMRHVSIGQWQECSFLNAKRIEK